MAHDDSEATRLVDQLVQQLQAQGKSEEATQILKFRGAGNSNQSTLQWVMPKLAGLGIIAAIGGGGYKLYQAHQENKRVELHRRATAVVRFSDPRELQLCADEVRKASLSWVAWKESYVVTPFYVDIGVTSGQASLLAVDKNNRSVAVNFEEVPKTPQKLILCRSIRAGEKEMQIFLPDPSHPEAAELTWLPA
jgi:hypothetical protein